MLTAMKWIDWLAHLRRWFKARNVVVNSENVEADELVDFPLISVVIFPKGQRITLL